MAGQTYDPYAVFADAPGPTPDLSHIPTAQLQALLDARNAAEAAGPASGAVRGNAGLFDDLIPSAPAAAGNSPRLVPVDGDPFAANGVSSQPQAVSSGNVFNQFDTPASTPQAAAGGATAAPQNDPYAQFADAPSPAPNGARPLTIQGPGNLQAAPGPVAGPTDPNAQGAPAGAPVQRTPQLIPVEVSARSANTGILDRSMEVTGVGTASAPARFRPNTRSLDRHVSVGPDLLHADLLGVSANGHEEILLVTSDLEHATDGRPHLVDMLRDVRALTQAQNAIDDLSRRQGEGIRRCKGIDQSLTASADTISIEDHG